MGILLIISSIIVGYLLIKQFLNTGNAIVNVMGSCVVGCIFSGTILYILDIAAVRLLNNYYIGIIIYFTLVLIYILTHLIKMEIVSKFKEDITMLFKDKTAIICFIIFSIFSVWLNYSTFSVAGGDIKVSGGAWSDIMYHNAYVRSVAMGNNVPVEYPYFANSPMHYHFLFGYYTGKISQMGLNSVHALNIMSSIGLVSLLMLLVEFGRIYFKSTAAGVLGSLFLIFHSSFSAFPWFNENMNNNIVDKILKKDGWLSGATFEGWGLFNLNVFVNQRHFALLLAFLVFVVNVFFVYRKEYKEQPDKIFSFDGIKWINKGLFLGVLIACIPFWNAPICTVVLAVLGCLALTVYRKKYLFVSLVCALFVGGLFVLPQLYMFKTGDTILSQYPKLHLGYALDKFDFLEFVKYYFNILGIKSILILISFIVVSVKKKVEFLIFLIPFIVANIFQLGYVLYDNNKMIFMWLIFANVFAAYLLVWIYKKFGTIILPSLLVLALVSAGFVDFFAIKNMKSVTIKYESSSLKDWIVKNTKPSDIFLTSTFIPYGDNNMSLINLTGRKLYAVKNCVDGSCPVEKRLKNIYKIYNFDEGVDKTVDLIKEQKIDYIVVDDTVKDDKKINLLDENFKSLDLKFKDGNTSIYGIKQ